jgi:hypothetical protein
MPVYELYSLVTYAHQLVVISAPHPMVIPAQQRVTIATCVVYSMMGAATGCVRDESGVVQTSLGRSFLESTSQQLRAPEKQVVRYPVLPRRELAGQWYRHDGLRASWLSYQA